MIRNIKCPKESHFYTLVYCALSDRKKLRCQSISDAGFNDCSTILEG